MRAFLLRALTFLGVHWLFRFLHRHSLTILWYHGVAPKRDEGIYNHRKRFIDPLVFARQMEYLRRKYTILPLEEAILRLHEGTLPAHTMAITFDGGYENNYTYAFPVLRAHSVPATVYLTTDFIDKKKPLWTDRLEYLVGMAQSGDGTPKEEKIATDIILRERLENCPSDKREARLKDLEEASGTALKDFSGDRAGYAPLSWEECRMMRSWRIAFGTRTKSSPTLSRLSIFEQREEISESRTVASRALGTTSNIFAYPGGKTGDWTEETADTLEELGFLGALTAIPGTNTRRSDPFAMKRIAMDGTEDWNIFLLTATGVLGMFGRIKRLFTRS